MGEGDGDYFLWVLGLRIGYGLWAIVGYKWMRAKFFFSSQAG